VQQVRRRCRRNDLNHSCQGASNVFRNKIRQIRIVRFFLSEAQPKNAIIIPPPKFGNDCKQARLFYKTNKYFQAKKNGTGH
jgi:hypothetical protein